MSAPARGSCTKTISPQNMTMKASSTYLLESQKTGGNRVHSQRAHTKPSLRVRSQGLPQQFFGFLELGSSCGHLPDGFWRPQFSSAALVGGAGSQALSCAGRVPRWPGAQGLLMPVACWVSDTARGSQFRCRRAGRRGQLPGLIRLKGGRFQNGRWPSPHVCGTRRSPKWLLPALRPQGELQLPPASPGDSLRPTGLASVIQKFRLSKFITESHLLPYKNPCRRNLTRRTAAFLPRSTSRAAHSH
nr:uncharacterized protein LOC110133497 [Odocoileus virginianus texanus]